jgi:hypothetical protein
VLAPNVSNASVRAFSIAKDSATAELAAVAVAVNTVGMLFSYHIFTANKNGYVNTTKG